MNGEAGHGFLGPFRLRQKHMTFCIDKMLFLKVYVCKTKGVNEFFLITFLILRKRTATTGRQMTSEKQRRNSLLMTRHYPDVGSASDWSCRVGNLIQPIRSTTQIWVVTRNQYGISALVPQTSFGGETSGSVAKCSLFSQVSFIFNR